MKINYIDKNFREESLRIIETANKIIKTYKDQGFDLTLRQLYYQFISSDLFSNSWIDKKTGSTNNEKSYKRLGAIINNGRLSGLIDWDSIVDRTRETHLYNSWDSIPEIIQSCEYAYSLDKWEFQNKMVEVWIEKDALVDVVEKACGSWEVPFFSCRGYVSQSAMWRASQRILNYDRPTTILHLGDHDPSGIDMSRDIQDRMQMFKVDNVTVKRIALTQSQINKYNPPPNPTKVTDSRAAKYIEAFGIECWELDALQPKVLVDLITTNIKDIIDMEILETTQIKQRIGREKIREIASKLEYEEDY